MTDSRTFKYPLSSTSDSHICAFIYRVHKSKLRVFKAKQSGFNCGCHSTNFRFAFSPLPSLSPCCPSPVCVFTCFLFSKYAVKNCGLHLRGPLNYFGICHSFAEPPLLFFAKKILKIFIFILERHLPLSSLLNVTQTQALCST